MATDLPRFTITLDDGILAQVVEYQHTTGHATRSGAIQDLIRIGLLNRESYGVIPKIQRAPSLSKGALKIARAYDNELGDYDRKLLHLIVAYARARVVDEVTEQAPPNERTPEEDFADLTE